MRNKPRIPIVIIAICCLIVLIFIGKNLYSRKQRVDLLHAIEVNNSFKVSSLLKEGANPNMTNDEGLSFLQVSLEYKHPQLAILLIQAGADTKYRNIWGKTVLQSALGNDDLSTAMILIHKGAYVSESYNTNAFLLAAKNHQFELMTELMGQGFDINALPQNAQLPLIDAVNRDDKMVVVWLLDRKVNVNKSQNGGYSALIAACSKGYPSMVKLLLEHGADPNARIINKHLHDSYTALIDTLYNYNRVQPYPTAATHIGPTVLFPASKVQLEQEHAHRAEIVKLLLASGANVNCVDGHGETVISLAKKWKRDNIVDLLRKAGAKE